MPLWVAGMVVHEKMGLSCFFADVYSLWLSFRERMLSLWLAVCKLIDLFGLGRLHALHIWSNQISNYVAANFMFGSSCDKLNYPQTSLAGFNDNIRRLIAWHHKTI